jgi:hypothetical protein
MNFTHECRHTVFVFNWRSLASDSLSGEISFDLRLGLFPYKPVKIRFATNCV